ncbi:MAG TPA: CheR family methyltransferase, partial [Acidimicrobiales bacterium]|nr:CheR family methyltransferase [Acidimicrobiales bacterium]
RDFTRDYIRAGGTAAFSDYYKVYGERVRFDPTLVEPVVFAQHNLASDSRFNEFHLIVCRNVLIYFDRTLQDRVHELFHQSLVRFGILALGHKESIRFTSRAEDYAELDADEKLYRRAA